ncbi:hypothetical protein VitviT2T_028020 [Vitis vinifera]|uniref:Uncharacterized protein n=1 Tax=Vitis vinifera TaxID=29760 RepID=A0ABY9DRY1_VITVI|nr:hypothetical protein VitviT2T_028020 [Vitis vinifera]
MERESSDDEEDRQNLIDKHKRKLPHKSGFQIEDFKSGISAHRFSFNKRIAVVATKDISNRIAINIAVSMTLEA